MARILLAEDNPADVYLLREAFTAGGAANLDLVVVTDGEQALNFFTSGEAERPEPLSLVVLDLNLPKSDGGEVLRCIREHSTCRKVPVVILTSSDSPRDRATAQLLGANGYMTKPSDLDEFLALGPRLLRMADNATANAAVP